jgi:acetyl esterase/lipase
MKQALLILSFLSLTSLAMSQTEMPLYADSIPNLLPVPDKQGGVTGADGKLRISNVTRPTLTIYPAPAGKANGTAVIICPGGGYSMLAASHEGYDVARYFNEWGITAFVLKYRLPNDTSMPNKEIAPIQDAQRAIQVVRERAAEWGIDKNKVGIMGFSAGGHLASTAGTHFEHHYIDAGKKENLRPDFMILGYPVISFSDSIGHKGSRTRLLGEHPTEEKIKEYSNELHVTRKTPPTFLVHAKDDKTVPIPNSEHFYEALQKNKVPAEIYIYEKGGHGFGMINKTSEVKWMDVLEKWMRSRKLIK